MRRFSIFSLAVFAAVTACSPSADEPDAGSEGQLIDCALTEGAPVEPRCTMEIAEDGKSVTIRHPDGGFRRFTLLPGGAGVASADGADDIVQGLTDGKLEVSVAGERYYMPTRPAS